MQVYGGDRTSISDEELCSFLKDKLNIDAAGAFSSGQSIGSRTTEPAELPQKGRLQQGHRALTVEGFVSQTLPLLELERDAEVAQVGQQSSIRSWIEGNAVCHDRSVWDIQQ